MFSGGIDKQYGAVMGFLLCMAVKHQIYVSVKILNFTQWKIYIKMGFYHRPISSSRQKIKIRDHSPVNITCSKSAIETLEKGMKYVQS